MAGIADLAGGGGEGFSSRFSLTSYLPTYAAVLFLLLIVWSGAPGADISPGRALATADRLSGAEIAAAALGILLLAVVLHPLQLPLVRLLEGYWPSWVPGFLRRRADTRQATRRAQLDAAAQGRPGMRPAEAQAALAAGLELSRRFPPDSYPLLPTALGNVLRAAEATAGRGYGLEAVSTWPRLYPLLGDGVRAVVDDRRTAVDLACRLTATSAITALLAAALLVRGRWWVLIIAIPLALAWVAYRGAVQAAVAYGESLAVAFDLHRFDLLAALHLPLPSTPTEERKLNERLSRFWDQAVPLDDVVTYDHPGGDSEAGRPRLALEIGEHPDDVP
jgi:hypothetical protein